MNRFPLAGIRSEGQDAEARRSRGRMRRNKEWRLNGFFSQDYFVRFFKPKFVSVSVRGVVSEISYLREVFFAIESVKF